MKIQKNPNKIKILKNSKGNDLEEIKGMDIHVEHLRRDPAIDAIRLRRFKGRFDPRSQKPLPKRPEHFPFKAKRDFSFADSREAVFCEKNLESFKKGAFHNL